MMDVNILKLISSTIEVHISCHIPFKPNFLDE